MTGFGRTGRWFGSEHFGLRPDILTAGKGSRPGTGRSGWRLLRRGVRDRGPTGFVHGFTYSHHVVGAAVGHAVLQRLVEGDLVEASRTKGELLRKELEASLGDHPNVGDVRGLGLMVGVELSRTGPPPRRSLGPNG